MTCPICHARTHYEPGDSGGRHHPVEEGHEYCSCGWSEKDPTPLEAAEAQADSVYEDMKYRQLTEER